MSNGNIGRQERPNGVMIEAEQGANWLELHDLLLDEWLTVYRQVRQECGYPVGKDVILPVRVVTNLECMHSCGCEADADFIFGRSGHEEGSRHPTMRLIATCERCLRGSGAIPESEDEDASSGPIQ